MLLQNCDLALISFINPIFKDIEDRQKFIISVLTYVIIIMDIHGLKVIEKLGVAESKMYRLFLNVTPSIRKQVAVFRR